LLAAQGLEGNRGVDWLDLGSMTSCHPVFQFDSAEVASTELLLVPGPSETLWDCNSSRDICDRIFSLLTESGGRLGILRLVTSGASYGKFRHDVDRVFWLTEIILIDFRYLRVLISNLGAESC